MENPDTRKQNLHMCNSIVKPCGGFDQQTLSRLYNSISDIDPMNYMHTFSEAQKCVISKYLWEINVTHSGWNDME